MPGTSASRWTAPDSVGPVVPYSNKGVTTQPRTLPPIEIKHLAQSASAPALLPALQQVLAAPVKQMEAAAAALLVQAALGMQAAPVALPVGIAPEPDWRRGVIRPWQQRPSVATWCSMKPVDAGTTLMVPGSTLAFARPTLAVTELPVKAQWQMRPSVGTWCTLLVKEPEIIEVPVYRKFLLRPSVATWCAPLPHPEPAEPPSYRKWNLRPSTGTWCTVKLQRSLEDLTHWEPNPEETEAMNVLLVGRTNEIKDLSQKLREVSASLEKARTTGSAETAELQNTAEALERCVTYAQSEYDALEQWSLRRGLSQPSSPVTSPVMGHRNT